MDKKYELLKDDYIHYRWRTLYRIRALKDFSNVRVGELGGYIEKEANLSHEHNCWVYDNAKVCENARVYENARIYDNVTVCENASVYGSAKVFDNVKVYSNAMVHDNAKAFDNAMIYGQSEICGNAKISSKAQVCGNAKICEYAKIWGKAIVSGNVIINKGNIIGKASMPFKDIFQYPCRHRMLTAILTENDEILYSIGCQKNITEDEFIDRIYNEDGGLDENPHRQEYLKLIPLIKDYFKEGEDR